MNREQRKDIIEALGLAAIVASLIFLAYETRQNTNALYAQSRQAILEAALQEIAMQAEYPELSLNIIKKEPLSPAEQVRLDAWLSLILRVREFAWLQYRNGIIDEAQWETEMAVIVFIFDAERNRVWWNNAGRNYVGQTFQNFIDGIIAGTPATNEMWRDLTDWTAAEQK